MKRKHRSKLSHVSRNVRPIIRRMGENKPGFHAEIWARWGDIVGAGLARRFWPINFYRGTLVAAVANSSWMQELTYLRPTLLDRFAEEIGPNVVRDVRLVLDTHLKILPESRGKKAPPVDPSPIVLPPEIEAATSKIDDEELRNAAKRAVEAILKRDRDRRRNS